jgi:hypothetical protein
MPHSSVFSARGFIFAVGLANFPAQPRLLSALIGSYGFLSPFSNQLSFAFGEVCDAVVELDESMNILEDVHRLGAWLVHGRRES